MSGNYGKQLTEPLKIARVLCIFFVVYAHIGIPSLPTGSSGLALTLEFSVHFLHDGLSRISVPLLGVVSGFLAYGSIGKMSYLSLVKRKFLNLIVPMVAWSGIMVAILQSYGLITRDLAFLEARLPSDPLGWINAFIALTDWPANTPLYFLRDVFVCYILLPIFIFLVRANILLCAAFALGLFLSQGTFWIADQNIFNPVLRPSVASFFILGLVVGNLQSKITLTTINIRLRRILAPLAIITITAVCVRLLFLSGDVSNWMRQATGSIVRIFGLLTFWGCSYAASRHNFGANISKYERYSYLVFCMHYPLTYMLYQVVGTIFGWRQSWFLDVSLFLLSPVVCFFVARPIYGGLRGSRIGAILIGLPRSIENSK